MDYIKYAKKAIFLDGQGQALTTTDLSTLNFPADYAARMAVSEKLTMQNSGIQEQESMEAAVAGNVQELRQVTTTQLQFLFQSTKIWLMLLSLMTCAALSAIDHSPSKFPGPISEPQLLWEIINAGNAAIVLRTWLESGTVNSDGFTGYLISGVTTAFLFQSATW